MKKLLGLFIVSIEHILGGNTFLSIAGNLWLKFWLKTPFDLSIRNCVFCKKEPEREVD